MKKMGTVLDELFYDVQSPGSYGGLNSLYAAVKKKERKKVNQIRREEVVEKKVRDILYGDLSTEKKGWKKRKIYKLGDRFRISKTKHVFKKGYLPNWTEEVFTIVGRHNTQPPVYKISDYNGEMLEGTFYEEELQKIVKYDDVLYIVEKVLRKRKRKGRVEYFVK
uniref:Uncharacterized protein LOC100373972 n=1 Tax=Saccoglossus kowalevskii TaxID=10224 RepID=A0ABM0MGL9_SACKO|nr:PREDICTED: uncharacterized protein LOC100373972 [Saccoglossus kowalevskii]